MPPGSGRADLSGVRIPAGRGGPWAIPSTPSGIAARPRPTFRFPRRAGPRPRTVRRRVSPRCSRRWDHSRPPSRDRPAGVPPPWAAPLELGWTIVAGGKFTSDFRLGQDMAATRQRRGQPPRPKLSASKSAIRGNPFPSCTSCASGRVSSSESTAGRPILQLIWKIRKLLPVTPILSGRGQ